MLPDRPSREGRGPASQPMTGGGAGSLQLTLPLTVSDAGRPLASRAGMNRARLAISWQVVASSRAEPLERMMVHSATRT